jgi:hypothetical protein
VVFSKENGDFSQQDLALSFAIDKSWLQKADFTLPGDRAFREVNRNRGAGSGKWTLRQVNTVFDSRLTSLPVVAPTTTPPAAGEGNGDGATAATEPDFVSSRKGAVMQVGIYAPFYGPQTSWVHDGAVNTLFVAPVMRAGVQTIVGDDSVGTTNLEGQPDDVFNFWSFGFAIGHQKLSGTTNQTPEVISYLHLTWGKAEAFKYKEKITENGKDIENLINPTRLMVEGRLKIPDTPMQIGFDANLGEGHDDLRFIFGTRFDIGALFERLKTFH